MIDYTNIETARQAWDEAVKCVRRSGIKIAQNLRSNCSIASCGCSGFKKPATWGNGEHSEYAYTKAAHKIEWSYSWATEKHRASRDAIIFWRGVDDDDLSTAHLIVGVFQSYGFGVAWEGTTSDAIVIELNSWKHAD